MIIIFCGCCKRTKGNMDRCNYEYKPQHQKFRAKKLSFKLKVCKRWKHLVKDVSLLGISKYYNSSDQIYFSSDYYRSYSKLHLCLSLTKLTLCSARDHRCVVQSWKSKSTKGLHDQTVYGYKDVNHKESNTIKCIVHEYFEKSLQELNIHEREPHMHLKRHKCEDLYVKSTLKKETNMFENFLKCIPMTSISVFPVWQSSVEVGFRSLADGSSLSYYPTEVMNDEQYRIDSFKYFDCTRTPSAEILAKNGFYSSGYGPETVCFTCNLKYSNWKTDDNPAVIHRHLSPGCEFLKTIVENEPVYTGSLSESMGNLVINDEAYDSDASCASSSLFTSMTSEDDSDEEKQNGDDKLTEACAKKVDFKLSKTTCTSDSDNESAKSLTTSESSESDTGSDDSCAHCSGHSKTCKSLEKCTQNEKTKSLPKLRRSEKKSKKSKYLNFLHTNPSVPANPEKKLLAVRMSTFASFPSCARINTKKLAVAGFFFKGDVDRTQCFWCNLVIVNWLETDDPIEVHKQHSPHCPFLEQLEREKENKQACGFQNGYTQLGNGASNYEIPEYGKLRAMGFDSRDIENAIQYFQRAGVACSVGKMVEFLVKKHGLSQDGPNGNIHQSTVPNMTNGFSSLTNNGVTNPKQHMLDINKMQQNQYINPCQQSTAGIQQYNMITQPYHNSALPQSILMKSQQHGATYQQQIPSQHQYNGGPVQHTMIPQQYASRPQQQYTAFPQQYLQPGIHNGYTKQSPAINSGMCKTCDEEQACVLFKPCNEVVSCKECATILNRCPACAQTILQKICISFR